MTKRVALARALALDPEIVFLDEPTSGLDPIGAGDFDTLIATLQRTLGLTVFMVTHDLDSLHTVCDRIAVLADGKVIAAGTMDTMLASTHPWLRAYFHGKRSRAGHRRSGEASSRSWSMETRANYVLIGLFTLAVVLGVFGFVYWFQNIGGTGERAYYSVVFDGSVSGLRTGATVLFNGIRVGEVTGLKLDPKRPKQVIAVISIDKSVAVRKDTEVGLEFQGLTGIASVSLKGGSPAEPVLVGSKDNPPQLMAAAGRGAGRHARRARHAAADRRFDRAEPGSLPQRARQSRQVQPGAGAQFRPHRQDHRRAWRT